MRVPLGHGLVEVWGRRKQGATDTPAEAGACCPMRHCDASTAVGYDDHGSMDAANRVFHRIHAALAVQVLATQWRNRVRARQLSCQQRLPMLRDVVAKAWDDQDGGGS